MDHEPSLDRSDDGAFETMACPGCGSTQAEHFLNAGDDYTGRPGAFTYVRCDECDLIYQNPRLKLDHVKSYYDDAYLSHQRSLNFGALTPAVQWALAGHDRRKLEIVLRHARLTSASRLLDVGCARATFLKHVRERFGCEIAGVDFKDMSQVVDFDGIDFYHGLFYEQEFGDARFDVVTMWHFLEHCYDPRRSLATARELLADDGTLVIEVPSVDSWSFKVYGKHWPGVQAPQHTVLFDAKSCRRLVERSGLEVVEALPWGAFPPFFYFYLGAAFKLSKGRGFDVRRHLPSYFAAQASTWPVFSALRKQRLAMQVLICRKA